MDARKIARVRSAFEAVPRVEFLPDRRRTDAAFDAPLPIGFGQTNSQPTTVANMLALLDAPPGARILDVGSGSGWTTALLAYLAGASGRVIATELVAELRDMGAANVARVTGANDSTAAVPGGEPGQATRPSGALAGDFAPAEVRQATPGVLGAPEDAPFDRILVSAEPRTLPPELVDQLAPGGVMVIPVAGNMLRVERDADGDETTVTRHGTYRFVPLL